MADLDLIGRPVTGDHLHGLRRAVRGLARQSNDGSVGFPGAQAVTFKHKHLTTLEEKSFFVSEKADGVRCLLYIHVSRNKLLENYLVGIGHRSCFSPFAA